MQAMNQPPTENLLINISSNESALGPSERVKTAAQKAAFSMERYLEGSELVLSQLIAETFELNPKGVVCGHGSDDLLARVARAFLQPGDELICSVNGYQKIPNYAYANDANAIKASDCEFTADVDKILDCVTERTKIIMIANPDNPTGTWLAGEQIRKLATAIPANVLLVLDSAYYEYVSDSNFEDPKNLVESYSNVLMTRTFSKIYGLAGLRLGWLYAPVEIVDWLRRIGTTFPISNIAFECGKTAIGDCAHRRNVYRHNLSVRTQFVEALEELGLHVYPSQTNFVLVQFKKQPHTAEFVYKELRKQGILTRRMTSQAFNDCVRFTIGLRSEMNKVESVMRELFKPANCSG